MVKAKAKKKKGASPHACFHCGKPGAGSSCAHCGSDCQVADWKRHRRSCRAAVAAVARRATRARKATAAARAAGGCAANEERVICVGPVVAPVELPCGHAFPGGGGPRLCSSMLIKRQEALYMKSPKP